jgi:hypothetical protein
MYAGALRQIYLERTYALFTAARYRHVRQVVANYLNALSRPNRHRETASRCAVAHDYRVADAA